MRKLLEAFLAHAQSPIVRLQLLNGFILLVLVNQLFLWVTVAICGVLYYCLVRFYVIGWIKWQRRTYGRIRSWAASNLSLSRLADIADDDWDRYNGLEVGPRLLNGIGLMLMSSYLWEGRFVGTINIILNFGYFYLATQNGSSEVKLFTGRFNVCLQMLSVSLYGVSFGEEAARRMIIIRNLVALCYLESVHELFLQTVAFPSIYLCYRFGANSHLVYLPFAQFLLTVLPTEIFGLRLWLLAKFRTTRNVSPNTSVALVTMLVPLGTAFFSFGSGRNVAPAVDTQSPNAFFYQSFPAIGLFLVASKKLWANRLDKWLNPSFGLSRPSGRFAISNPENSSNLVNAAWISTLLVLGMSKQFAMTAFIGLIGLGICWNLTDAKKRQVFIALETALFVSFATNPSQGEAVSMALSCARLWLQFENRLFSDILAESLLLASIESYFVTRDVRKVILSMMLCGLIVSLALTMANENSAKFVKSVKDADSFLDHAVKQKFSAIGAGVDHVLELAKGKLDPATVKTLESAAKECQQSLVACHLSSCAIKYETGAFVPVGTSFPTLPLVHVLKDWSEEGFLQDQRILVEGDPEVALSLDWDLFKSLLMDLTKHCHIHNDLPSMKLQVTTDGSTAKLELKRCKESRKGHSGARQALVQDIRQSVVKSLGGRMSKENGSVLEFPLAKSVSVSPSLSSRSLSGSWTTASMTANDSAHSLTRQASPASVTAIISAMQEMATTLSVPLISTRNGDATTASSPPDLVCGTGISSRQLLEKHSSKESITSTVWVESSDGSTSHTSPTTSPSPRYFVRSLSAPPLQDAFTLPSGLSIAVLDDNSLVRKSLGFIIRLHLGADMERSFISGVTYREAMDFPQAIIDWKVDIAIFDENLEYPMDNQNTLKGTALASEALRKGFRGCMILHSANAALADSLDACFHGFVEKTSSRDQFIRCLTTAYERFKWGVERQPRPIDEEPKG